MDNTKLAEIQNLPAAELIEQLTALKVTELQALRDLEAASGDKARGDVLAAIDAALPPANERMTRVEGDGPEAGGDKPPATDSKAAKAAADETPAWQKPDYAGPLDIEKMDWRNRNIKPVTDVSTKAPKAGKTK